MHLQLSDPAYQSHPIAQPLLGFYLAARDRNRFQLPLALKAALVRSGVERVGIYVDLDHIVVVPLRPTSPPGPKGRFFITQIRDEAVAAVKVADLTARARIGIPKGFADTAALDPVLLLIGMGDRIEIWNSTRYFAKRRSLDGNGRPIELGSGGYFTLI